MGALHRIQLQREIVKHPYQALHPMGICKSMPCRAPPDGEEGDVAPRTKSRDHEALTDDTIHAAVKMWCNPHTRAQAVANWGEIGAWDVSRVTNMCGLFADEKEFNENISRWDT